MSIFDFPTDPDEQQAWARTFDTEEMGREYMRLRKIAVRRILLAGVRDCFQAIPELSRVDFSFAHKNPSLKDAITPVFDLDDETKTKKATANFQKIMGKCRSRCGMDRSTYEGVVLFFRGCERSLTRSNHELAIKLLFEEDASWDNITDVRIHALEIDDKTEHNSCPASPRMRL